MERVVVRVQVGHTTLSRSLSHIAVPTGPCRLCRTVPTAPRDDMSMLELRSTRLLRCELQLHKHHVVSNA